MTIECVEKSFWGLKNSTPRVVKPGTREVLESVQPKSRLSAGRELYVESADTIKVTHLFAGLIVRTVQKQRSEINTYDVNPKSQTKLGIRTSPVSRWDRLTGRTRVYAWKPTEERLPQFVNPARANRS